jgi:hypothetical protein
MTNFDEAVYFKYWVVAGLSRNGTIGQNLENKVYHKLP